MKFFYALFLAFFFAVLPSAAQVSRDFAVMANFEADDITPSIKLDWLPNNFVQFYEVYRRPYPAGNFSLLTTNLQDTFYTDTEIKEGATYEYMILARCLTQITLEGETNNFEWAATGYIIAGYRTEIPANGTVLLLVDNTLKGAIEEELEVYTDDLVNSGWNVRTRTVPRADSFDGAKVKEVKAIIAKEREEDKLISALVLIGHVPVPYSGNFIAAPGQVYPPDGHSDHCGAWPADLYYGVADESLWTDQTVTNTDASRAENRNVPGDGKFDQTMLPAKSDLQIGRIDFHNIKMTGKSEVELLKNYFDKLRKYKFARTVINKQTLIDDNFIPSYFDFLENFASTGWRNGASLTGKNTVSEKDWFDALGKSSYLFAYGTGPGGYSHCDGVTQSAQMMSNPHNAVFTLLFGSYFGDWDTESNLMRSAIASDPTILTCGWAARPHWYIHSMAYGYTMGHAAMMSQNNTNSYFNMLVYQYDGIKYSGESVQVGTGRIHAALMGDPTLTALDQERNNPDLLPPKELAITLADNNSVKVSWEMPPVDKIHHYDVFRSYSEKTGPWVKLNENPVTIGQYLDENAYDKDMNIWYMVRKRETTLTVNGNIELYGYGVNGYITIINAGNKAGESAFSLYPNPARDVLTLDVETAKPGNLNVRITDAAGRLIRTIDHGQTAPAVHKINVSLTDGAGNALADGIYFIEAGVPGSMRVGKFAVHR